jgi:hypothetical protein
MTQKLLICMDVCSDHNEGGQLWVIAPGHLTISCVIYKLVRGNGDVELKE